MKPLVSAIEWGIAVAKIEYDSVDLKYFQKSDNNDLIMIIAPSGKRKSAEKVRKSAVLLPKGVWKQVIATK